MDDHHTDRPVCPNSGYEHYDTWEWFDNNNDYATVSCENCDLDFSVRRNIFIDYTTFLPNNE